MSATNLSVSFTRDALREGRDLNLRALLDQIDFVRIVRGDPRVAVMVQTDPNRINELRRRLGPACVVSDVPSLSLL